MNKNRRSFRVGLLSCGLLVLLAVVPILLMWQQAQLEHAARIKAAPHITAEYLTSTYEKDRTAAHHQFDGKMIVLTGSVSGMDEGLIGDGCIHIGGAIECDVGGNFRGVGVGQQVTIMGICDGMGAYGEIFLHNCSRLQQAGANE